MNQSRLDAGGVLQPSRTGGGHRRYSRRQLRRPARLRELFDEGHPLAAAHRIASLEEELSTSDGRLRSAGADLDRRTDELAATHRELETARDRIAALDRALHGGPGDSGAGPAAP